MTWKLGDMSALEAWRKKNPNWRKDNARKAAATRAAKKAAREAAARAAAEAARIASGDLTGEEILQQIFETYGTFQDCDSCGLRPEEDTDLCVVNRKMVERGRRRMCKHYATPEQVAAAQAELDKRGIIPILRVDDTNVV